ncbi:hypothetical protein JHK82_019025 [Glycine max]|nr:hypothetical protein JHK82_019025 [Glycine max]
MDDHDDIDILASSTPGEMLLPRSIGSKNQSAAWDHIDKLSDPNPLSQGFKEDIAVICRVHAVVMAIKVWQKLQAQVDKLSEAKLEERPSIRTRRPCNHFNLLMLTHTGLVGLGLSKLFHVFGLEDLALDDLSNSMGLFLQV